VSDHEFIRGPIRGPFRGPIRESSTQPILYAKPAKACCVNRRVNLLKQVSSYQTTNSFVGLFAVPFVSLRRNRPLRNQKLVQVIQCAVHQ
jgi:hypothetical protein